MMLSIFMCSLVICLPSFEDRHIWEMYTQSFQRLIYKSNFNWLLLLLLLNCKNSLYILYTIPLSAIWFVNIPFLSLCNFLDNVVANQLKFSITDLQYCVRFTCAAEWFRYVCIYVSCAALSPSVMSAVCDLVDCSPLGSSVHGDSPGKNTEVGTLSLLQGIFPSQELNQGLLHCRWILYQLSYQGSLLLICYC